MVLSDVIQREALFQAEEGISRADSAPSGISGANPAPMNRKQRDEPSQRESDDRFAPPPQSRFVWSLFHGSRILVKARFAQMALKLNYDRAFCLGAQRIEGG